MRFLLNTDKGNKQVAEGKMSYSISEIDLDGMPVSQTRLLIGLNKFYSEIYDIRCEIGVFEDVKLLSISGGSEDNVIVYEIITSHFSLNPDVIENLLETFSDTTEE